MPVCASCNRRGEARARLARQPAERRAGGTQHEHPGRSLAADRKQTTTFCCAVQGLHGGPLNRGTSVGGGPPGSVTVVIGALGGRFSINVHRGDREKTTTATTALRFAIC
jgi:hypothetical protein